MKRKVSLFLAVLMLMSCIALPTFAEESKALPQVEWRLIPASGDQIALGYLDGTAILEVDGLKFKDMNANGKLDEYEDWRAEISSRVEDLRSQMTLEEKLALMIHCNTSGQYTGTYPATYEYLYEQNCPFAVEDLGKWDTASGYSAWWYINKYGITHFLDNTNGTAAEQIEVHNAIQAMCEETRLGVPMTFSCDRYYNGWGGWTDAPHDAMATANDPELLNKLIEAYCAEMRAIGYHLLLHPYGVEIGAFYGENPEYIAKMTNIEVSAIENNGMQACTKHWIARGGDSSFPNARSVAQTVDNWMVPWKAAIEAGTSYIMCSTLSGLSNQGSVVFDKQSMSYLRDTLGFDGVVLTDWTQIAAWGVSCTGVTPEGIDLSTLSLKELYGLMFSNGVDQVGNVSVMPGQDHNVYYMSSAYPEAMKAAVAEGYLAEETVDAAAGRILKAKFELGLFENPYSDAETAMELCASKEYLAAPWTINNANELAAARNPELVALERQLQAESTVLVKNDGDLLPLKEGTKVYFISMNAVNQSNYSAELATSFSVVDAIGEADVVVVDANAINDALELTMEDAKAAGKPVVITLNCVDPTTWVVENADAVLFLNYKCTPDHGSALDGFSFTMEACVYNELLCGKAQPAGMIVKEIARNSQLDALQWKDLAGDQGASNAVRLMLLATMKENSEKAVPNNWGDPLLGYEYGMHYGEKGDFEYEALIVPMMAVESTNAYGRVIVSGIPAPVKSGETFTVSFLLWNHGEDDMLKVHACDGETVMAEKIVAVNGGSWRVVEMDLAFETAGDHVLTIGDLSTTITVE